MNTDLEAAALVDNELDLLASLVPLTDQRIIELGCGAAQLSRELLSRFAGSRVMALEVDQRQHAKNLVRPQPGLAFAAAGAQAIPAADASFDGALMLKSLHHVPLALMATALAEVARVLRPGGWLYVSEPVYAGAFNDLIRLFNDEAEVRAAAQQALDDALRSGAWIARHDRRFEMPVRFNSFDEFEQRVMRPTFADHALDEAKLAEVRAAYALQSGAGGTLALTRPMRLTLLQRRG